MLARFTTLLLVLLAALMLAACGGDDDSGSDDGGSGDGGSGGGQTLDLTATGTDLKFDKSELTAKAGSVTLKFTNGSTLQHNVAGIIVCTFDDVETASAWLKLM